MKRILYLFSLLLCCHLLSAKERVIEQPSFAAWSSTSLEISKIVLSDTATVLYIDAFYSPKMWIKIATGSYIQADGKQYPITRGIGMELDKEIWMPESGTYSFQMVFPPLPPTAKELDFSEGDFDGSFSIWGIRLDGKPATSAWVGKENPKEPPVLEIPEFKSGVAILRGHITGYQPDMNLKGRLWVMNVLTTGGQEYSMAVEPDGTFRCELPLLHLSPVSLYAPFFKGTLYLKPGEETVMEVNLPEVCRSQSRIQKEKPSLGEMYYFTGALSALNNEACNHPLTISIYPETQEDFMKLQEKTSRFSPAEFKQYWKDKLKEMQEQLNRKDDPLSDAYRQILSQNIYAVIARNICFPKQSIEGAYCMTHRSESADAAMPEDKKPVVTRDYFEDSFRELISNSPLALYSPEYPYLIRGLSYADFTGNPAPGKMVKQQNVPGLAEVIGTDQGILFDLIRANVLASDIVEFSLLDEAQLKQVMGFTPAFRDALLSMNDQLKLTLEENKKRSGYVVDRVNIADIPAEELFNAITTPYRGKVVFVDFWATWCSPCREALKEAEPVKAELVGKDVVFLYLACENSPLKTWEQMIKDIKGEHYRVTDAQWEYWVKKFGIAGVPSYMIVGKEGVPTHFQTEFMGADKMKEMLLQELDK